jgi:hypothetical protein
MTPRRMKLVGMRPSQRSQAMSNRVRVFIVPLVVLSVVLVALMVAIVVVVVVRARSDSAAGQIDRCVVGNWQVVTHREQVTMPRLGGVTFTGTGTGARVRLNSDGTAVTDYGTATRFDGVTAGHKIRLDVTGKVTYEYAAAGGRVSFRDPVSDAKGTIFLDGAKSTEVAFSAPTDPADYECSGDRLVFRTRLYETTFTRVAR